MSNLLLNTLWITSLKHLLFFNSHLGSYKNQTTDGVKRNRGWFGNSLLGIFQNNLIIDLNYTLFMLKKSLNLLTDVLSFSGELLIMYGNRNHDYSNFMYYLSTKYSSNLDLNTLAYTFFYKRRYHYSVGWLGGVLTNWRHLYWRSRLITKYINQLPLKNPHLWSGLINMHFLPGILWVVNYYTYGVREGILSSIPTVSVCNSFSPISDLFYVISSNTDEYWNMSFYTVLLREFVFFHYVNKWKNIKKSCILKFNS